MKNLTLKQTRVILLVIMLVTYLALEVYSLTDEESYFVKTYLLLTYILKNIAFALGLMVLCDYLAHKLKKEEY